MWLQHSLAWAPLCRASIIGQQQQRLLAGAASFAGSLRMHTIAHDELLFEGSNHCAIRQYGAMPASVDVAKVCEERAMVHHSHVLTIKRARPLDGRSVAAAWQGELAAGVPAIASALGRPPSLAVVVVGQRPDSLLYVSRKLEACTQVRLCSPARAATRQHHLHTPLPTCCIFFTFPYM